MSDVRKADRGRKMDFDQKKRAFCPGLSQNEKARLNQQD